MESKYTAADYVHFDKVPIKRALISVSDKTGLVELAKALMAAGVEIVSTGSTAKTISEAKIPVTEVSAVTGFQETLDGRVKTLHPAIHAGLLADLRLTGHRNELEKLGVSAFQLLVVNLYPFVEAIAAGGNTRGVSGCNNLALRIVGDSGCTEPNGCNVLLVHADKKLQELGALVYPQEHQSGCHRVQCPGVANLSGVEDLSKLGHHVKRGDTSGLIYED